MTYLDAIRELREAPRPAVAPLTEVQGALGEQVRRRPTLAAQGEVRWGFVFMANDALWTGKRSAPAAVIYSRDPWFDRYPHELANTGDRLLDLFGSTHRPVAPHARYTSDLHRSGHVRSFGQPIPAEMTGGRVVCSSSVWVRLSDLPSRRLVSRVLPLWVDGDGYVMPVVGSVWPQWVLDRWAASDSDASTDGS
ncbi:MAG: hypothetical protein R3F61_36515 [Myxococcota bacterium]